MRPTLTILLCLFASLALADESSSLQDRINAKYRHFFGPDSQSLLPLPKMETADWKSMQQSQALTRIYAEPGKFYNGKVYTFTLYQSPQDKRYYLDAKGGFWGMDELVYGPLEGEAWLAP